MSARPHRGGSGGVDGYQPAWNMSTTLTYIARHRTLRRRPSLPSRRNGTRAARDIRRLREREIRRAGRREHDAAAAPAACSSDDLIELLFFAYRDFVGDPDRILAEYGFGRAHHRVLHFVDRYPGLTIAELLDILRITKQSLNRVLKDLIEQGYVAQRPGTSDRRQRLLYLHRERPAPGRRPHPRAGAAPGAGAGRSPEDAAAPPRAS